MNIDEQKLKDRIIHLKKHELEYFDKSVDKSYNPAERRVYRGFSNEIQARRNELEKLLREGRIQEGENCPKCHSKNLYKWIYACKDCKHEWSS